MRKYFTIFFFLFEDVYSYSQTHKVFAKIEITSISMNEQRSFIDTSIVIVLEKFGYTDIINLGKIDTTEVGLQLEILNSHLGEKKIILNGIALFTKKLSKWEMYSDPTYQFSNYKTISDKSLITEKDLTHTTLSIQDLQIEYTQVFYVINKFKQ